MFAGPFASISIMDQNTVTLFPGTGASLGDTQHVDGTIGGMAGFDVPPGAFFYGLLGASLRNTTAFINFGPVTRVNKMDPGVTFGAGVMQPIAGTSMAFFMQWTYTHYEKFTIDGGAASPAFTYTFGRDENKLTAGLMWHLPYAVSSAPYSPLPTK